MTWKWNEIVLWISNLKPKQRTETTSGSFNNFLHDALWKLSIFPVTYINNFPLPSYAVDEMKRWASFVVSMRVNREFCVLCKGKRQEQCEFSSFAGDSILIRSEAFSEALKKFKQENVSSDASLNLCIAEKSRTSSVDEYGENFLVYHSFKKTLI